MSGRILLTHLLSLALVTLWIQHAILLHCDAAGLSRVAVVSVVNETKEPEFGNLLITQGIASLVAQELYDTGQFVPIEDNPDIARKIQELLQLSTTSDNKDSGKIDTVEVRDQLGCDVIANAKIKNLSKSRSRMFIGPFSGANVEVRLDVEVILHGRDGHSMAATGSGTGTTKSRGILFEVRNDKVHFDETSIGKATQEAVHQAVAKLIKGKEGK